MPDLRDSAADARPRALLLDGDRASRAEVRRMLESAGWRADHWAGSPESLRVRGIGRPRVVLADWPRLESLWPHLLAAREDGGGAPHLVALIDPARERDALSALAAGADDCLLRPIRPADLATRLAVALRCGSERRGARDALAAARGDRDAMAAVLCSIPDGLVILAPDTTVVEVNDGFCAMTGLARAALLGRRALFPSWPDPERPRLEAMLSECERLGAAERDVLLPRACGERRPAIVSAAPARTPAGASGGYVVTVKDVSERVRAAAALPSGPAAATSAGAVADPVTGLAGARAFADALAREVERGRRSGRPLALVLVDVDDLRGAARRLRRCARAGDALARTGAAELAWLLPETGERAAHACAARLRRALAEEAGGLGASLGIAVAAGSLGPADLYHRAGEALRRAKLSGRDRAVLYSSPAAA